jgi:hypothetical protein
MAGTINRGMIEDAEFETIPPKRGIAQAKPGTAQSGPDPLSILKRGHDAATPGLFYWFFVFASAAGAFWFAGGYTLFR